MPKSKIVLIALGVVTVSVTLLYTLTPRRADLPPRPEQVTGLVMRGYEEGSVTWETLAERGEIASATGSLENVVLRVLGEETTLEVRAAELARQAESVTLTGDVRAETDEGLLVSSEQMTWWEDTRVLESGATQLSLQGDELSADAFTYDARTQSATLVGVRATLADASLAASSNAGEISRDTIRLLANVHVYSTEDAASVQAASRPTFEVTADALTLSRDGVTANGNVSADIRFAPEGDDRGA
jgi:hypothetical protein